MTESSPTDDSRDSLSLTSDQSKQIPGMHTHNERPRTHKMAA